MNKIKILIIHTAFIGDIILSTPLIHKIKDVYPNSLLEYVTTPAGAEILKGNKFLDDIIVYDKKGKDKGALALYRLIKKLRNKKFDIVITIHRYLRSTLISFFTGSKERIGYDIAAGAFLYTKKVKYERTKHEVEKLLSFIPIDTKKDYKIELYSDTRSEEKAKDILKGYNGKKKLVIAPGSKWFTKQWPATYFDQVIKKISKREDTVIIITGGKEEENIPLTCEQNVIDLRGKTSLRELIAIIKNSDIVLANDSSPIHIASAFDNVKIFAVFGPTVKELGFFPWTKNSKVYEIKDLKCRPCTLHGGPKCPEGHFKCMMDIHPDMIIRDIESVLDEKEKKE